MKIGIIGGGMMGLVLAKKLADPAHEITVFERSDQIGGLATYQKYDNFYWDRFYHVILPSDSHLIQFIKEIGLEDQLRWKKTYTGVYVDEQFYSVSNNKEFLLFPPLNMIQKFRLALTILYASRIKDWRKMEKLTVEDWLVKIGGRKTYEKFWKPLLLAKLGEAYRRVSAVFIWTYIKRLFEARDSSAHQEQMGYVSGGYKTVFDQLEELFNQENVTLHKSISVQNIRKNEGGGIIVTHDGGESDFDKVIFTAPVNVLEKIVHSDLYEVSKPDKQVEYLGVICMVLLTEEPLTPFYVLNIADKTIPFTGVIGLSTLVDTAETSGYHVTYLPKYIISTDPLLRSSDEEIEQSFLAGLEKMYPDFPKEKIKKVYINRAIKVQPVQVLNYSQIVPKTTTKHKDFYVLNTSQFVNDTLNNNSVVRHVNRFVEENKDHFFADLKSHKVIQ